MAERKMAEKKPADESVGESQTYDVKAANKGPYNLDDPNVVNLFLSTISTFQVSPSHGPTRTSASRTTASDRSPSAAPRKSDTSKNDQADPADVGAADRPESVAPSLSTYGFVTPSPSPTACVSIREEADSPLEPFHEDGSVILRALADASNLTLYDSKYASKNYNGKTKYSAIPTRRAPVLSFDQSFKTLDENRAEDSASKKSEHERLVSKYQDEVLAKFIENRLPEGKSKPDSRTKPFPTSEHPDPKSSNQQASDKVTESTMDTSGGGVPIDNNATMFVTAPAEATKDDDEGEEEDRENLKHFSAWGTPERRSRAAARPRKIRLFNLPTDSDLTLVQSLIHGGAIETFNLTHTKTSAYVTFVDADACDAYFSAHPNGITFKNPKTRRHHVVYVDRGQNVDVVSSVLQAYRDCQASRVVRATGADEDWGMGALHKLAEAKKRKVENIIDTYRDKTRTIIFRFTNIADAVAFRGELMRDEEWEMCNIQFMEDPAETATGVHLEE